MDKKVEEPAHLLCPITLALLRDPVFVPQSGNTYERDALERYWATTRGQRDPITNVEVASTAVYTNWDKRREVQAFLDLHPDYLPEGWQSRTVPVPTPTDASPFSAVGGVWRLFHPAQPGSASFTRRCIWLGVLAVVATATWSNWDTAGGVSVHLADDQHEPSPALAALFEERSKLTRNDPAYTRRAQAESVLGDKSALEVEDDVGAFNAATGQRLVGSHIRVQRDESYLRIEIPPLRLLDPEVVYGGIFASMWLGFTTVWTMSAVHQGAPVMFVVFSAPFWFVGAHLVHQTLVPAMETLTLEMDDVRFELGRHWRGIDVGRHGGFTMDLMPAQIVASSAVVTANTEVQQELRLYEGINCHVIGKHVKTAEMQYVAHEINAFLRDAKAIRLKTACGAHC